MHKSSPLAALLLCMMWNAPLPAASLAGMAAPESLMYAVDDSDLLGPATSGVSPTAGSGIVCLNHFRIVGPFTTITEVTIQWGLLVGVSQFSVGIWSDPNSDGIPDDAVLLATSPPTSAIQGSYLQRVSLPTGQYIGPEGTSFFVGVYWQESDQPKVGLFLGKDRPVTHGSPSWSKKWAGMPPDPSDVSGAKVLQGSHRAFVIRPTGIVPEPSAGLWLAPAMLAFLRRRRAGGR